MSNSSLICYTRLSPNRNSPRNQPIRKITIHHMAGNLSIEQCGEIFSRKSRQASSNYGIGTDGRVALYVDEKDRSWCSSSPENDHQAITIEVANDGGAPDWHVSDKALAACIDLCTDICKRNGIKCLNFTGDVSGNLTMHKWFAPTACPGPYLGSKFPYIAAEVNKRLSSNKDGWQNRGEKWLYYRAGKPLHSQWLHEGKWWYYLGANGEMVTGWKQIGRETFYFNPVRHKSSGLTVPTGACIITDDRGNVK